MRLRWILPLFAALVVGAGWWIGAHASRVSAELLLASARARLEAPMPSGATVTREDWLRYNAERAVAGRELDEALRLARGEEQRPQRAEILRRRSELYASQGLSELALDDCRTLCAEFEPEVETLTRASDLCLQLGRPAAALEYATTLAPLDPARGKSRIGRCRVALADAPLAALQRLARTALPLSAASEAATLAQRAAVFAADESVRAAAQEELLDLFTRPDERRLATEWVREAAEHLELARNAFIESLAPGSTSEAVAGLQDLLLRGGSPREAADLGRVALLLPAFPNPMPVLARTASAMALLGRLEAARTLILAIKQKTPAALRPQALPSNALRDELQEWCLLLDQLGLWEDLRNGALELVARNPGESPKRQLGLYLQARAHLNQKDLRTAGRVLEFVGSNLGTEHDLAVRVWMARAAVAEGHGQKAPERYALLQATKAAPLDVPAHLRAEIGRAWQRMYTLQMEDGDFLGAEVSLTHALRCLPERQGELEPLWHELGRKSLATRGVSSPYLLYSRAKSEDDRALAVPALSDARTLLKSYPGFGPALEIVSRAANKLRDFPLMISASLELIERGWPPSGASARLREVPREYFLPQDRVRWMQLDPRGSLEAVVRNLLSKGDVLGAALAARGGPARFQPPELLPLLAEVQVEAGLQGPALETLDLLVPQGAPFRSAVSLALRAGLARTLLTRQERPLAAQLERVLASGPAEDARLPQAIDALLSAGRVAESEQLLLWLEPQSLPFLGEVLLRATTARLLAGRSTPIDDALERAAALLADRRPLLGRLILALEHGDAAALAREAQEGLVAGQGERIAERIALLVLAGDLPGAEGALAREPRDGREPLLQLCAEALAQLTPPADTDQPSPELAPFQADRIAPLRALVLALAAEVPPWSSWVLARTADLAPGLRQEPWLRCLRAQAWLALGTPELARGELGEGGPGTTSDARLAWMQVRLAQADGRSASELRAARLAWFALSGLEAGAGAEAALLAAEAAMARDAREEAVRLLEEARLRWPAESGLTRRLAEFESVEGRRARGLALYAELFARESASAAADLVLPYLELAEAARAQGEISESRWWTEVEALEAERPLDPAPPRALAARAFQQPELGPEQGRAVGLARLQRFRARSLGRSLEELRQGETQRWVTLLARFVPERAVTLAEQELRRDPADPALWRASSEALLAAGRWQPALARLEALQRVAPERETARLLALTSYRIENDGEEFLQRLAAIERIDEGARHDPVLNFYRGLASVGLRGKDRPEQITLATELWRERESNGLDDPEHGRALAIALFQGNKRDAALVVLSAAFLGVRTELEGDVLEAMGYLMRAAKVAPPAPPAATPPAAAAAPADDSLPAPGARPGPVPAPPSAPEPGSDGADASAAPEPR